MKPGFIQPPLGQIIQAGDGGSRASGSIQPLDLADIQGFVLRAYMMPPMVRHFLLRIEAPAQDT